MLRRLSEIKGFGLQARDGEIGQVRDFYFDDQFWVVRYLVVSTGAWLGRDVLIARQAVSGISLDQQTMAVGLSQQQIQDSPSADLQRPLSRDYESTYYSYFGYEPYWAPVALPGALPAVPITPAENPIPASLSSEAGHVHSANEVQGFHIHALDGEVGHVDDFLFDDDSWAITLLEVDTSNWIGGTSVYIPQPAILETQWAQQALRVNLTRQQVQSSPRNPFQTNLDKETQHHG
jgi:uncharacterized protein YrrD